MPKVNIENVHSPYHASVLLGGMTQQNRHSFFVLPNINKLQNEFHGHLQNNIKSVTMKSAARK